MFSKPFRAIVLVALLGTIAHANEADPNLIAHWKLDEGAGETITDAVLGTTGTIDGATWVNDPERGWVLNFSGTDVVDMNMPGSNNFAGVTDEMTVAFWQNGALNMFETRSCVFDIRAVTSQQAMVYMSHANGSIQWYCPTSPTLNYMAPMGKEEEVEGSWSYWAFTKNANTGEMKIYRNGEVYATDTGKTAVVDGAGVTVMTLGMKYNYTFGYKGMLSDLRFYDRELTQTEIKVLMSPGITNYAGQPYPRNNAQNVPTDVVLHWTCGDLAASHDVYFGTVFEDVNAAADPGVLPGRGSYDVNSYEPGTLEAGVTYYWRVDEVNGPDIWRGSIWSFTTVLPEAHNPSPEDGEMGVDVAPVLTWSPGALASAVDGHRVYFGTDRQAVSDANVAVGLGVYKGLFSAEQYAPGTLQLGERYYWRVDEVNGPSIWPGGVWHFNVKDFVVVDDMESYGEAATPGEPGSRVWYTWRDGFGWSEPAPGQAGNGTGSTVGNADAPFVETQIVHSGKQSMPFSYDNSGANEKAYYSEVQAAVDDLQISHDWARGGAKALALFFHGSKDNDAGPNEQMYLALRDGGNRTAVVPYDGPSSDIQQEQWQRWAISLEQFTNDGLDVTDVQQVYLGFGDRDNPQPGGSGKVYFDDIRLYPSTCVLEYAPDADMTDDCVVDVVDLKVMANDWLASDYYLAVQEPVSPVGRWAMDEGTGGATFDSVMDTRGILYDATWAQDTEQGWVLSFNGDASVDCDTTHSNNFAGISDEMSVTLWQYGASDMYKTRSCAIDVRAGTDQQAMVYMSHSNGSVQWYCPTSPTLNYMTCVVAEEDVEGKWSHWAFTKNAATGEMKIYRNGVEIASETDKTASIDGAGVTIMTIGQKYNHTYGYQGMLSDLRVYDYELSQDEVTYLATDGTGYVPLQSRTVNFFEDEQIDFKDFALFAVQWLEEVLWP